MLLSDERAYLRVRITSYVELLKVYVKPKTWPKRLTAACNLLPLFVGVIIGQTAFQTGLCCKRQKLAVGCLDYTVMVKRRFL